MCPIPVPKAAGCECGCAVGFLIDCVARSQLHTNLRQRQQSPGAPRCPPRNFYLRIWESGVCPAEGCRLWTKLLPEAGGCNLMFLPEAAGGGQNFCQRLGSSMIKASPTSWPELGPPAASGSNQSGCMPPAFLGPLGQGSH